jgi:tight adherence protein C
MPITLLILIAIGVAGLAAAGFVFLEEMSRRQIVERSGGGRAQPGARVRVVRDASRREQRLQKVLRRAPSLWAEDESVRTRLVQAGYDSPVAPLAYSMIRVVSLVLFPAIVIIVLQDVTFWQRTLAIIGATIVGLAAPVWYLLRLVRLRQEKIRRSLPDALDLLVVCVEAGISLDAAILRVAKDIVYAHSELAHELHVVNRKTNAGVPREHALRGLWERTGVDELRTLVSSLIQSEKWGTSSARVLRVASETLRRNRRQAAEKRAATAPVKMVIPLALLIFPALFVVILGPAAIAIAAAFSGR